MGSLRKLDKKFLILVCCLILIPLLLIVFLIMAQGCSNKKTGYSKYEFNMKSAAKKYLNKIDNVPSENGDYVLVDLNTLVDQSYIESTKKALNDDTCTGYVSVRKQDKVNYVAVLTCENYKSNTLVETLKKDLVETESGLYKSNDGYVFKGQKVNNYIKLGSDVYRIMSIDNSNRVKVIKDKSESASRTWDTRYNIETNSSDGINTFKDSNIYDKLNSLYNESAKINRIKKYMVSTDVCVYSKNSKDRFLNKDNCSEVIKNQYITLLSIDDYMNASLDPNCTDLYSKSCRNYNYLHKMNINSWTKDVVADNNYQVYYMSDGTLYAQTARMTSDYYIVLYLDGNIQVTSGNGTEKTPYIVK